MKQENKKVVVAMSGGVDSSVAAMILKNKGYEVTGLFLNMHKSFDAKPAQQAAKKIDIPLQILNVQKEFNKKVINYFINEYKQGRTPNPCVECNHGVKFKFLLAKMKKIKADFIATGHYARLEENKHGTARLLIAKDKTKDQTYFLWRLTQKELKNTIFPVGDYTKKEINQMAEQWNLPAAKKRESHEICFIPDAKLYKFLKPRINVKGGDIVTVNGEKVGKHQGLIFYTIGQRKGIKVGGIGPFYVVNKDFKNNTLVVAKAEHASELYAKQMKIEKVSWISGKQPEFPLSCEVKIRYLHSANPAIIKKSGKNLKVIFNKKQRAITPGQSAVIYKHQQVLGGGIIV